MSTDRSADLRASHDPSRTPGDDFLIAGVLGGDAAALDKLIERYDRLVRYTVLRATPDRCRQDPQWLDSIASATWAGFVRSVRRSPDDPPQSVAAYLARIARNQCATALRQASPPVESLDRGEDEDPLDTSVELEEPAEELARIELLDALRGCLADLNGDDRTMAAQLPAITERRWRDAASALGLSESTLRSRWKRTLDRLRRCIRRKTG